MLDVRRLHSSCLVRKGITPNPNPGEPGQSLELGHRPHSPVTSEHLPTEVTPGQSLELSAPTYVPAAGSTRPQPYTAASLPLRAPDPPLPPAPDVRFMSVMSSANAAGASRCTCIHCPTWKCCHATAAATSPSTYNALHSEPATLVFAPGKTRVSDEESLPQHKYVPRAPPDMPHHLELRAARQGRRGRRTCC